MADVMKATPKDQISKVFLEEKLFKTWYDGRTVLLGDGKSLFSLFLLFLFVSMSVKFSVGQLLTTVLAIEHPFLAIACHKVKAEYE